MMFVINFNCFVKYKFPVMFIIVSKENVVMSLINLLHHLKTSGQDSFYLEYKWEPIDAHTRSQNDFFGRISTKRMNIDLLFKLVIELDFGC